MKKIILSMAPDALMTFGAFGIAYGASMIYVPAGFIIGGLFLLVAGVLGARTKSK